MRTLVVNLEYHKNSSFLNYFARSREGYYWQADTEKDLLKKIRRFARSEGYQKIRLRVGIFDLPYFKTFLKP